MAKQKTEIFYKTKKWKKKRRAKLRKDEYECRQCKRYGKRVQAVLVHHIYPIETYPELSLVDDNLISLCDTCHENMHNRFTGEITKLGKEWQRRVSHLVDNKQIEDKENVIRNGHKVIIVWGAPGSGKTTYVKKNMKYGDMVIDLDFIKQAISFQEETEAPDSLLDVALKVRELLYSIVAGRQIPECTVWVVAGLPDYRERKELKNRLQANELIYMKASREQCIRRVLADDTRKDKELQRKIVAKWFRNYTEPPT